MPISRFAMAVVLPVLLASAPFAVAASEVPKLDIGPSCRAAATAGISVDRSEDACRRDEQQARRVDDVGQRERAEGAFDVDQGAALGPFQIGAAR